MVKYYIILDFEATCDSKRHKPQEIIEIPSVVIDAKTLGIIDKIQIYVRPVVRPILTRYCTELTGITQKIVDVAQTFPRCYERYTEWLSQYDDYIIVTCGDWDLRLMLPAQCKLSGRKVIPGMKKWINIQDTFREKYGINGGLKSMLKYLNLDHVGRHHSGIDDCINTARIWIHMHI